MRTLGAVLLTVVGFWMLVSLSGCSANVEPNPFARFGGLSRALRLTINWPPRSRTLNAPSAALSAQVTLVGAKPGGGDVTFSVDRGVDAAGGDQTYDVPLETKNGEFTIAVAYYAGAGGAAGGSAVVGGYTAQIRVVPNSQGVADITPEADENPNVDGDFTDPVVASVEVAADQVITIGQAPVELGFVARDRSGSVIPVTRGSAIFRVESGGESRLSLTPDGIATGVSPGTASVTATVNRVTSLPTTVTVTSGAGDTDITIR